MNNKIIKYTEQYFIDNEDNGKVPSTLYLISYKNSDDELLYNMGITIESIKETLSNFPEYKIEFSHDDNLHKNWLNMQEFIKFKQDFVIDDESIRETDILFKEDS